MGMHTKDDSFVSLTRNEAVGRYVTDCRAALLMLARSNSKRLGGSEDVGRNLSINPGSVLVAHETCSHRAHVPL